jgi:hypothetical protein
LITENLDGAEEVLALEKEPPFDGKPPLDSPLPYVLLTSELSRYSQTIQTHLFSPPSALSPPRNVIASPLSG